MPILDNIQNHKILLDTHIWLWSLTANPQLPKNFVNFLEHHRLTNNIFVSPLSIWEIGMLVNKERIILDMDVLDLVNLTLDTSGIQLAPLTPYIAIQSTRIPGTIHGDPVDRILIATAQINNIALVTCDQKILKYGEGNFISVYDPTKKY